MLYSEINSSGTIVIEEAVICQIIEETISDCYANKVWISDRKGQASSFVMMIGAKDVTDDIEMYLENGQLFLKLYVILRFGLSIKQVTGELIQSLKEIIRENTAIPVKEITIVVTGVMSRQVARRNIKIRG